VLSTPLKAILIHGANGFTSAGYNDQDIETVARARKRLVTRGERLDAITGKDPQPVYLVAFNVSAHRRVGGSYLGCSFSPSDAEKGAYRSSHTRYVKHLTEEARGSPYHS
jgi:hypothetical protein